MTKADMLPAQRFSLLVVKLLLESSTGTAPLQSVLEYKNILKCINDKSLSADLREMHDMPQFYFGKCTQQFVSRMPQKPGVLLLRPRVLEVTGSNQYYPYYYISTTDALDQVMDGSSVWSGKCEGVMSLNLEGVPDAIALLQVSLTNTAITTDEDILISSIETYVFDGVSIGQETLVRRLQAFLQSTNVIKLVHDVHQIAYSLSKCVPEVTLNGLLDTQLVMELFSKATSGEDNKLQESHQRTHSQLGPKRILAGMNAFLEAWHPERCVHTTKRAMHTRMNQSASSCMLKRPLESQILEYAATDVILLQECVPALSFSCEQRKLLLDASKLRVEAAIKHRGQRSVWFDTEYQLRSTELLWVTQQIAPQPPLQPMHDSETLTALIPQRFRDAELLSGDQAPAIVDIVLDKGRRAYALVDEIGHLDLIPGDSDAGIVTQDDIDSVVHTLGGSSRFGADNRAGLDGSLHRISAMRNKANAIYGLSLRVGRAFPGNSDLIADILHLHSPHPTSVLILGKPGHGKTTLIRDIARTLSSSGTQTVCIIDTSNEIAGDGDVPHSHIGRARRMMVPRLNEQAQIMIECVQNHTVKTMIIDEVGRSTEVSAARTVRQRGVGIIASAHGDLRSLIKNVDLRGLVGGIETVIIGDAAAAKNRSQNGSKLQAQRIAEPPFDVVVELCARNECNVIMNVGEAVDAVLAGQSFKAQRRQRDKEIGCVLMELVNI